MTINSKLNQLIASSKELYYRLVLIVGDKDECSKIISEVAENYGKYPININFKLSEKLIQLNYKKRQIKLQNLMWDLVKDEKEIVFLIDTEILFDSTLQQDPLKVLQEISRNISVVAYWGGEINNTKLIYAIPNHSEYREYSLNDVVYITTEGKNSFELDR